jgi:hypothetical protein
MVSSVVSEVTLPVQVGKAHAGRLRRKLRGRNGGGQAPEATKRLEDDAIVGVAPRVRVKLGLDRRGDRLRKIFGAEALQDLLFQGRSKPLWEAVWHDSCILIQEPARGQFDATSGACA